MKSWIKLYTETNHDPKIGTLTWAQRGLWTAMLALAGEIDARSEGGVETGELDTVANVGWRLRCSPDELADAIQAFTERGMIDEREGVLFVTNYGKRQGRAPSARRKAVAERVKRHRAKQETTNDAQASDDVTSEKRECNVVTLSVQRGVTPSESESE